MKTSISNELQENLGWTKGQCELQGQMFSDKTILYLLQQAF